MNQKLHHSETSFREEYVTFLKAYNVDFDEKYIFKNCLE